MTASDGELLGAFELHWVEGIRAALDNGWDPRLPIRGKLPIDWLVEMYSRSDRFPECLRLLLDHGAQWADPVVEPVLMNDCDALKKQIAERPSLVEHRTSMVCCFTPLVGATLLHVAAEYGHYDAARVLIEAGADANARAAVDKFGLNGHTPVFHAVNSSKNRSEPVLRLLLEAGADVGIRLNGITWGKGFDWETTLFDVTPISYAQMGLLPQVHRTEADTYHNIRLMLKAAGRAEPPLDNVPNQYLNPRPTCQ